MSKTDIFGKQWVGNYPSRKIAEALKTSATVLVKISEPMHESRYHGYFISKDDTKEFETWIRQKDNVSEIIWIT